MLICSSYIVKIYFIIIRVIGLKDFLKLYFENYI